MTHLFQALGQCVDSWREDLNPDRLAYRVLFADTVLHDEGKRAVKEFILGGTAS